MTQEDKQLLLKDISARLPYGVIVEIISCGQENLKPWFGELSCKDLDCFIHDVAYKSIKPYLRPMSSMTEEEVDEFTQFDVYADGEYVMPNHEAVDWLNKNMFDYRGLIPKGLAIEVTEQNSPYKD